MERQLAMEQMEVFRTLKFVYVRIMENGRFPLLDDLKRELDSTGINSAIDQIQRHVGHKAQNWSPWLSTLYTDPEFLTDSTLDLIQKGFENVAELPTDEYEFETGEKNETYTTSGADKQLGWDVDNSNLEAIPPGTEAKMTVLAATAETTSWRVAKTKARVPEQLQSLRKHAKNGKDYTEKVQKFRKIFKSVKSIAGIKRQYYDGFYEYNQEGRKVAGFDLGKPWAWMSSKMVSAARWFVSRTMASSAPPDKERELWGEKWEDVEKRCDKNERDKAKRAAETWKWWQYLDPKRWNANWMDPSQYVECYLIRTYTQKSRFYVQHQGMDEETLWSFANALGVANSDRGAVTEVSEPGDAWPCEDQRMATDVKCRARGKTQLSFSRRRTKIWKHGPRQNQEFRSLGVLTFDAKAPVQAGQFRVVQCGRHQHVVKVEEARAEVHQAIVTLEAGGGSGDNKMFTEERNPGGASDVPFSQDCNEDEGLEEIENRSQCFKAANFLFGTPAAAPTPGGDAELEAKRNQFAESRGQQLTENDLIHETKRPRLISARAQHLPAEGFWRLDLATELKIRYKQKSSVYFDSSSVVTMPMKISQGTMPDLRSPTYVAATSDTPDPEDDADGRAKLWLPSTNQLQNSSVLLRFTVQSTNKKWFSGARRRLPQGTSPT